MSAPPAKTAAKRRTRRKESWSLYVYGVLKVVHPDLAISGKAMAVVNSIVNEQFDSLCRLAGDLVRASGRQTLKARDLQYAIRLSLPGALLKHAMDDGDRAVQAYNAQCAGTKARAVTQSCRAGLQFPVGRVHRLLRARRVSARVGADAAVFIAAVLEYLCAELLELAGNAAKQHRRQRINNRALQLAIQNDAELLQLASGVIAQGGVLPGVHAALTPASKNK